MKELKSNRNINPYDLSSVGRLNKSASIAKSFKNYSASPYSGYNSSSKSNKTQSANNTSQTRFKNTLG